MSANQAFQTHEKDSGKMRRSRGEKGEWVNYNEKIEC